MKTCSRCSLEKDFSEFSKNKNSKDGFKSACKKCIANDRSKNKDQINSRKRELYKTSDKTNHKEYSKKYREDNKEEIKESKNKYYKDNKESISIKSKKYRSENKDKLSKYKRDKRISDPVFKIKENLRSRLYRAIKDDAKTGSAINDLGCSIEYFKKHIEKLFSDNMSWDNYGEVWHLDHRYPLSKIDVENREELLLAINYKNIQPMDSLKNLSKGDTIDLSDPEVLDIQNKINSIRK